MGRITALALTTAAVCGFVMFSAVASPQATADTATRCAELFPESEWVAVEGLSVDVGMSDVPPGRMERFAAEIDSTAAAVTSDLGGLEGSAVCVVGPDSGFDGTRYAEPPTRFHAAVDGPSNVIVISAASPGNVSPASAFAIPHLALWNLSGGEGWPEPIASTIAQWYRAVALDRMALYRVESTGADFSVDPISGEGNYGLDFSTDPRIDWLSSQQVAVRSWDPATNEAAIGYFIDYTVTQNGIESITSLEATEWSEREEAWRTSLVADMTGRTEPTTGWISGVTIAAIAIVVAAGLAISGFITKRRSKRTAR